MPKGVHDSYVRGSAHRWWKHDRDMRHIAGRPVSASTYKNHGCRCLECTRAVAEYRSARRPRERRNTKYAARFQGLACHYHPAVAAILAHEDIMKEDAA